jgi:hypothetical protein
MKEICIWKSEGNVKGKSASVPKHQAIKAYREGAKASRILNLVITRSLHDLHEMNAYRAGHACLSVCLYDSTREPLDGFGLNLVRT